ncbi:MAG: hypothetical protein OXC01_15770 [Immundisolibacterales bacterium]|nr:hypothetical protein [Immundisolibacterales bacterium]
MQAAASGASRRASVRTQRARGISDAPSFFFLLRTTITMLGIIITTTADNIDGNTCCT